jgi:MFS family permease
MFADQGLSDGQISLLFLIWSAVGIVAEVPTGAIADRFSRRGSLAAGSVAQGLGYALWMALPGFPGYAAGFVLWGLGGALASGSLEALLYDGLKTYGATRLYSRVLGRITAAGLIAQLPAALAATVLFQVGGYALVGWLSVGCCLTAAALAWLLRDVRPVGDDARAGHHLVQEPEAIQVGGPDGDQFGAGEPAGSPAGPVRPAARGAGELGDSECGDDECGDDECGDDELDDDDSGLGYFQTLRVGILEAVAAPAVRGLVLVVAALTGLDALEEYFTLVALDWGVPVPWIPLAALGIPLVGAAGTWWIAHRSPSKKPFTAALLALALGSGAVLLGLSEWFGEPAGLVGVAVFYGLYQVVMVAVNTRLQDAITGPARATVNSVAGLLSELAAIAIYGLWALNGLSMIAGLILLLAVLLPLAMRRRASA